MPKIKQKPVAKVYSPERQLAFGIYQPNPEVELYSMAVFSDKKQVTCTCSNPLPIQPLSSFAIFIGESTIFKVWEQNSTFLLEKNGEILGQTGIPKSSHSAGNEECEDSHIDECDDGHECVIGEHDSE